MPPKIASAFDDRDDSMRKLEQDIVLTKEALRRTTVEMTDVRKEMEEVVRLIIG